MSAALSVSGASFVNFFDFNIQKHNIEENELYQWDALLRYHFKITNPELLNDDEYFKLCAQLKWVIKEENNKYKKQD